MAQGARSTRSVSAKSDGLRLTKVGQWFLVFLVVVATAATNTSNNGLYLVAATMAAALLVSHGLASRNVRRLRLQARGHGEVFAGQLVHLDVEVENRGWMPRWWLLVTLAEGLAKDGLAKDRRHLRARPFLVSYLRRRERVVGEVGVIFPRRGRQKVARIHVWSLFPFGFYRKGMRHAADLDVLVYPELFSAATVRVEQSGRSGEEAVGRVGWGHEMLGLRNYRVGDDPRHIHWKQSARTGQLIFQEHESEENRRLLVVLDNAVGELDAARREVFEHLISEAATALVDYLDQGHEVALLTREGFLGFSSGSRQRLAVLETLALLEERPRNSRPLAVPDMQGAHLHLALDGDAAGRSRQREAA